MSFWIEIHMISLINSRKLLETLKETKFILENYKIYKLFTHHLWCVSLAAIILKKLLYGRVGGVSRGGYSYPRILITWRLCHYFWKLPIFSFCQLLFLLFCYINFVIKFHIHTFVWMDTSSIDYWHFQTLWYIS